MTLSQEMLEALLDGFPDGVSLVEAAPGHRVVYVNHAGARMNGGDRAVLTGAPSRLFGESVEATVRGQLEAAIAESRQARVLFRDRRADGAEFWHDVQLQPAGAAAITPHPPCTSPKTPPSP